MDAQYISDQMERLKVNKRGAIRNKGRVQDAILSKHLTEIDSLITKIRLHVQSRKGLVSIDKKELDEYLANLQIS